MSARERNWRSIGVAIAAAVALSGCGFGGDEREEALLDQPQIGVNALLWRASLDTFAFMPFQTLDPYGGVIVTDWYSLPNVPNERFQARVFILDTRLRADAVKVALNRQVVTVNGWSDAPVDPDTALQLENKILDQARTLRLSAVGG